MADSLLYENVNHTTALHGHPDTHYVFSPQPYNPHNAIITEMHQMCVSEIQEITKKLEEWQFRYYPEKRCLNIEVIDDTALIGNGKLIRKNRLKSEEEEKKKQQPRRRGGKGRKKKKSASVGKKEVVMVYSREEMEALRFQNFDDQKKKWAEVYGGLGAEVAAEYDRLIVRSADINKKHGGSSFRFDRRSFFQTFSNLDAVAAIERRNLCSEE